MKRIKNVLQAAVKLHKRNWERSQNYCTNRNCAARINTRVRTRCHPDVDSIKYKQYKKTTIPGIRLALLYLLFSLPTSYYL